MSAILRHLPLKTHASGIVSDGSRCIAAGHVVSRERPFWPMIRLSPSHQRRLFR
jgi:hypothetical protein